MTKKTEQRAKRKIKIKVTWLPWEFTWGFTCSLSRHQKKRVKYV